MQLKQLKNQIRNFNFSHSWNGAMFLHAVIFQHSDGNVSSGSESALQSTNSSTFF